MAGTRLLTQGSFVFGTLILCIILYFVVFHDPSPILPPIEQTFQRIDNWNFPFTCFSVSRQTDRVTECKPLSGLSLNQCSYNIGQPCFTLVNYSIDFYQGTKTAVHDGDCLHHSLTAALPFDSIIKEESLKNHPVKIISKNILTLVKSINNNQSQDIRLKSYFLEPKPIHLYLILACDGSNIPDEINNIYSVISMDIFYKFQILHKIEDIQIFKFKFLNISWKDKYHYDNTFNFNYISKIELENENSFFHKIFKNNLIQCINNCHNLFIILYLPSNYSTIPFFITKSNKKYNETLSSSSLPSSSPSDAWSSSSRRTSTSTSLILPPKKSTFHIINSHNAINNNNSTNSSTNAVVDDLLRGIYSACRQLLGLSLSLDTTNANTHFSEIKDDGNSNSIDNDVTNNNESVEGSVSSTSQRQSVMIMTTSETSPSPETTTTTAQTLSPSAETLSSTLPLSLHLASEWELLWLTMARWQHMVDSTVRHVAYIHDKLQHSNELPMTMTATGTESFLEEYKTLRLRMTELEDHISNCNQKQNQDHCEVINNVHAYVSYNRLYHIHKTAKALSEHPSLLRKPYFPFQNKVALFAPFWLPICVPLVHGLYKEIKRYQEKRITRSVS